MKKPNNHEVDSFKNLIQFNSIINEHRPTTSETQPRVDRRNIETAQAVIERGLSPIREDLRQGSQYSSKQDLKAFEYKALLDWAKETEFLFSFQKFSENWSLQGEMRGREHFVYFDEPLNRWIKKNILTYHSTYGEYFQRLHLHNQIFPESPYDLIGFIQENDNLFPVVSQQDIQSIRGASHEEVSAMMKLIGFIPVPKTNDAYLSEDESIEIKDLHDQNALVTPSGKISVIDPLIRILDESKAKHWLKERGMIL